MTNISVKRLNIPGKKRFVIHIDMKNFHLGDSCINGTLLRLYKEYSDFNESMTLSDFFNSIYAVSLFNLKSAFHIARSFEHIEAFFHDLDYIKKEFSFKTHCYMEDDQYNCATEIYVKDCTLGDK